MKFLKTFEGREPVNYNRDIEYKYLDKKTTVIIEEFIDNFIEELNIFELIKKLKYPYFIENDFNYYDIFCSLLTFQRNIFTEVDKYCRENEIYVGKPELRNSMFNIIEKIYKEYVDLGFNLYLDNQLIKEFQDKPEKYKSRYEIYGDKFSEKVKSECEYILTAKNFNL